MPETRWTFIPETEDEESWALRMLLLERLAQIDLTMHTLSAFMAESSPTTSDNLRQNADRVLRIEALIGRTDNLAKKDIKHA